MNRSKYFIVMLAAAGLLSKVGEASLPDFLEGSYGTFLYCQGCTDPVVKGETHIVILERSRNAPAEVTVHLDSGMQIMKFVVTKVSESGDYLQGDSAVGENIPGSVRILFNLESGDLSGVISTVPNDIYIRGKQEVSVAQVSNTTGIVPTISSEEVAGEYEGQYNGVRSRITVREKPEGGSYYGVKRTGSRATMYFQHGEFDAVKGVLVLMHEPGIKWTLAVREDVDRNRVWTGMGLSNLRGGHYPLEYKKLQQ